MDSPMKRIDDGIAFAKEAIRKSKEINSQELRKHIAECAEAQIEALLAIRMFFH
jgi:hypothetical protein